MIFILRKNFLDLGIWRIQKFDNMIYLIVIFYSSRFLQIFLGLEGKRFFLNIIRYSIIEIFCSYRPGGRNGFFIAIIIFIHGIIINIIFFLPPIRSYSRPFSRRFGFHKKIRN